MVQFVLYEWMKIPQQILFGFTIELFRRPLDGLHCVLGVAVRHFSHLKDAFHGGQHPRPLYCVAPDVRRTSLEEWSRDFLPLQHKKKMVQQWLEALIVPFQKPFFIIQSQLACDDEYFDSFSWAPAPKSSGNDRQKAAKVCKYFFKKCAVMCKSHFEWLWPRPRGSDALVCIYQETRISAWRCYRLHRGYSLCHPKSDIQRTNWW